MSQEDTYNITLNQVPFFKVIKAYLWDFFKPGTEKLVGGNQFDLMDERGFPKVSLKISVLHADREHILYSILAMNISNSVKYKLVNFFKELSGNNSDYLEYLRVDRMKSDVPGLVITCFNLREKIRERIDEPLTKAELELIEQSKEATKDFQF